MKQVLLMIVMVALVGCGKKEPVQPAATNTEATKPEKETGKEATQPTTPNTEATKPEPTKAAERPNVVFILADDLGYGDLSCYGATHFETPACDRLAREGLRFTDAHSPSAVCTPTRYATLTGRYAWRTWLKNWVTFEHHPLLIDTNRLTMGKLFQKAGYTTGCVGKWHLGWGTELNPDYSGEVKPGPLEVGFDSFFGVPFSHNSSKPLRVYTRDRRIVNLKPGLSYKSPEAMKDTVRKLEDTAIELSREAVAFVDRNKDKPFFLFYPTTNVHFPLTPNSRFKDQTKAGVYGEFVVEFDWAVGELLAALERNGLTENTIVVLTSDNGGRPPTKTLERKAYNGHQCNGPWRGTKRQIYEGGHRVPLIIRWPGKVQKSSVTAETVCLTDFFATFAAILEQPIPENAGEDSYDLSNVLLGKPYAKPLREATVHHSVSGQFAIRQGDWKLIEGGGDGDYPRTAEGRMDVKSRELERDPATGKWTRLDYFQLKPDGKLQLYDLRNDPVERTDLTAVHPEKVQELKKLLDHYRASGRSVSPRVP
jgi:arylsulfatase A-like enzyme/predicted small lipoprotein YifL